MSNGTEPRKSSKAIERAIAIAGFCILLIVTLLGWNQTSNKAAAVTAVMQEKIDRLEKEWDMYDFGVFEYKLEAMDEKLDEIKTLIEAL